MWDLWCTVSLGQQVVLMKFSSPLSISLHDWSTLTISILPSPERWADETWEPSNTDTGEQWTEMYFHIVTQTSRVKNLESCLFPLSEPMSGMTISHWYIYLSQYDDPCFTKKAEGSQIQQSSFPFTSDILLLNLKITYHMSHSLDLPMFPLTQPCHGLGRQLQASPRRICDRRQAYDSVVSEYFSFHLLVIIPLMIHIHIPFTYHWPYR
jgi:hypothetical protein